LICGIISKHRVPRGPSSELPSGGQWIASDSCIFLPPSNQPNVSVCVAADGSAPPPLHPRPPPLSRRVGHFKCVCRHSWKSNDVWVTRETHKCYQGEECGACGRVLKPFYITRLPETIFDRRTTPHPAKRGSAGNRKDKMKKFIGQRNVHHSKFKRKGK
jgi:zygote arrest protein 1